MLFSGKIFVTISLLAVLAISVRGQPDSCIPDPCEGVECPRFLGADCRVNQELCTATFIWKGRDVTSRCSVPTCDDRQCGRNRDCMEEVFPPSCPRGTSCRQFIRTRCVLRPFERPMSCEDIECGEGMMCRFRERPGGFRPVVRCIPAVPENCSEIECEEGFMCLLRGRRPICVRVPPTSPPITTEPTSCEQVTCDFGYQCMETDTGPECTPLFVADSCSELNCAAFLFTCIQFSENQAQCIPPTECTEEINENCLKVFSVCGELAGGLISCVAANSCEQLSCGEDMMCVEAPGSPTVATCIPTAGPPTIGVDCNNLACPSDRSCYLQIYPSMNLTFAQCFPDDVLNGIAGGIQFRLSTCATKQCPREDSCIGFHRDDVFDRAECAQTGCANDNQCPPDSECVTLSETVLSSICSPIEFQAMAGNQVCGEINRECPEGSECQDVHVSGELIGTICRAQAKSGKTCDEIACTGNEGCAIVEIPSKPNLPRLAQCQANLAAITTGISNGLRALGLIP